MINIKIENDFIKVFFPKYNPDWVEKIRSISGSRWNKDEKCWVLPMDDNTLTQILANFGDQIKDISQNFQVVFNARERFPGYQVYFYETVAVPEELLEKIGFSEIERESIRPFSQWRIDYPLNENEIILPNKHRQILSVLHKILTRGSITLASPKIEETFKAIFKPIESEFNEETVEYLSFKGYKKTPVKPWLDSNEELIFYREILPQILGDNYHQFIIPQVRISSLSNLLSFRDVFIKSGVVDFVILHPKLGKKIIVEIDGKQHFKHMQADEYRDDILLSFGYTVIRIPASEVRERQGKQINLLKSILKNLESSNIKVSSGTVKFMHSLKIAHQIQITLFHAIYSGFLDMNKIGKWHIISDLHEVGFFNREEAMLILENAVFDFIELLSRVCEIYSENIQNEKPKVNLASEDVFQKIHRANFADNTIFISFSDKYTPQLPIFYIQNIFFTHHLVNYSIPAEPPLEDTLNPTEDNLKYFLNYLFRKPYFWEGQYEGISRALKRKDTLILLPTGGGKSMIFQLATMLLPGVTIVIEPIISLMEDQVMNLTSIGIDRCVTISSQIENYLVRKRILELMQDGNYIFVYVSPERFQIQDFRNSIRSLTTHIPISFVVVDEAHCVSEWGHDFRPAYLNIGKTAREVCGNGKYTPPLIALTGTASRAVLRDIRRELQINEYEATITPKSFDREELKFHIITCKSNEKLAKLIGYIKHELPGLFNTSAINMFKLRGKNTYSGLVFCPHVNGPFGVTEVYSYVEKTKGFDVSIGIYSGKNPRNFAGGEERYKNHKIETAKMFKRNQIQLLICTKAFGMGIDKPNIRFTIHLNLPPSIESFYQEAGRAGRDKKVAHCCIIVSNDDPKRSELLLNPNTSVEEIEKIINRLDHEQNDDITRILYFHVNSFRGVEKEKNYIEKILNQLGDIKLRRTVNVTPTIEFISGTTDEESEHDAREDSSTARLITEKALHRLLLIGVVSDYTIDYSKNEFTVETSGAERDEIINNYTRYIENYLYSRAQQERKKAEEIAKNENLTHKEFVMAIIELLLKFIYDVIERGRRRALYEMLLACTSKSEFDFRTRILRYLSTTGYTEKLEKIISERADLNFDIFLDLIGSVASQNDFAELRGEVSRFLESYPDHPSLLMLRSLTESFSKDPDKEVIRQNFIASISSALTKYGVSIETTSKFLFQSLLMISEREKNLADEILYQSLEMIPDRKFARKLIELDMEQTKDEIKFSHIPAWFLLKNINEKCTNLSIIK
jgi:RecQ family ATP-dependent DNA helicase